MSTLDEAIDNVDATGGRKYIIMSLSARRQLSALARANGQIDIVRTEFGYQQMNYAGIPVLELDRNNKNIPILDADPTDQDCYVVSFGTDQLCGIQNGGVNVRNLGESHVLPQMVTRVEWYCGLALINGRAAARLANFNSNASV